MCGQHTMQQTLTILDVNIERAHTASFAAVLSRLALLEAENSALQVRVTTLEGISSSSSAPLSDDDDDELMLNVLRCHETY